MALICPHCKAAEAISYVENEDGKTLFPCLFCDLPPSPGSTNRTSTASAQCATQLCGGEVHDHYEYGPRGRLITVRREPCRTCGSSRTGLQNGPSLRSRALPDARL
ncbi:hypothetical protein ACFXP3_23900 [Streptomyces sp. NPDC059096]|uniref:hypothetical protein n=1 Tax=Streptomyces sp. NPDC059096 TaxID=3346727 RepID=UPI00369A33F6